MVDEEGKEHDVGDWYDMIGRGVQRARQVLWMRAADKRENYKGVERGVDEATTDRLYRSLGKKDQKRAGALHTVLSD